MSYHAPHSFWEYDTWLSPSDVAIIGGGIVGMQAALHIKSQQPKLKITIIEQSSMGTAASSRNAGFACYGSPSEILDDLQTMSKSEVIDLVAKRVKGLALLRSVVGDAGLKYELTGGHEIFVDRDAYKYHRDRLSEINDILSEVDSSLIFSEAKVPDHFGQVAGILSNEWEGQIHPGAMTDTLRKLCQRKGIRVLTNLKVKEINRSDKIELITDDHTIVADKLIVCNNAFVKDLMPLPTTAVRNQVLLTSEIPNLKLNGCFHFNQGYVYFRNVGQRVLIGGGRHLDKDGEETNAFGQSAPIQSYLKQFLAEHILPGMDYTIEHKWSGILGFNETKEPIIKEIEPDIFVAVGLGGMGVAIGSLIGQEVANLLLQS